MIMKKIIIILAFMAASVGAFAQNAKVYADRYNMMVARLGYAGVGVETVISHWERADSADADMLKAKYLYYLTKSQTYEIVINDNPKYLGQDPVMSLKDSLGKMSHYYQITKYDDELFGKALRALDKGIVFYPENLDFRFSKAAALLDYEKEHPELTLSLLMELAEMNAEKRYKWTYPDIEDADEEMVINSIQDYCYRLYMIKSEGSLEAFRTLSEKMSDLYPKNVLFIDNMGSYYMSKQEYRTALKYYNRALKIKEDDYPAIKNCALIATRLDDRKLQKKYYKLLAEYGASEAEKLSAKAKLESLGKRK